MLKNLLTTYDCKSVGTAGGVWDGWQGGFQGTKKSRGILEGESPRQLKFQRPV